MKRRGRKSPSKHDKEVENGENNSDDQDSVENEDDTKRANTSKKSDNGEDLEIEAKNKKRGRSSRKAESGDESEEEQNKSKRKSKKMKSTKSTENGDKEEDDEPEEDYEVEAVLDEKRIRGVKHYLIRWKGYESESDTWEPESTLNCPDLIEEFKSKRNRKPAAEDKSKSKKTDKKTKKREKKKENKEATWDENKEFEVQRILEVHFRRDGSREFLVHWKGYPTSEDTWEPEEHMDCKDMIEKFMEKVEKAKAVDNRELRGNRSHTNRFTLSMDAKGRRLSKRFQGKQRATYHDAE